MDLSRKRAEEVKRTVRDIRDIVESQGETRPAVKAILDKVKALAARKELWEGYAPPEEGDLQARYLVSEEPDHSYALYLNVMRPGKKIVPHNHTTWACIAAVSGTEENRLYKRLDAGGSSGPAKLEQTGTVMVEPGTGLALLGEDIHAVLIPAGQTIRHLHMYGRALETLDRRLGYDLEKGTCSIMGLSVKSRR